MKFIQIEIDQINLKFDWKKNDWTLLILQIKLRSLLSFIKLSFFGIKDSNVTTLNNPHNKVTWSMSFYMSVCTKKYH